MVFGFIKCAMRVMKCWKREEKQWIEIPNQICIRMLGKKKRLQVRGKIGSLNNKKTVGKERIWRTRKLHKIEKRRTKTNRPNEKKIADYGIKSNRRRDKIEILFESRKGGK